MIDMQVLCRWFEANKRDLPWRKNPTFYSVWVSEVMLQQTQAQVVISYFFRWMKLFPTVEALAMAPEEAVIKAWEGLGYYSRARRLHAGAKAVASVGPGADLETLLPKIPGLGPYTRGAILSFVFRRRAVALDGNVIRVISRFYNVQDLVDKVAIRRRLEGLVEEALPTVRPWVAMEGLIELGALVCQKEPKCLTCPLKKGCAGRRAGTAAILPNKKKPVSTIYLERQVLLLRCGDEALIKKVEAGKVMAGLYEFPYFEEGEAAEYIKKLGLMAHFETKMGEQKQTFTRYRVSLYPALYVTQKRIAVPGYEWVPVIKLTQLPFSSGHRRVMKELHAYITH